MMKLISIATLTTVLSTTNQRFVFPDDRMFLQKSLEIKYNVKSANDESTNEIEDDHVTKSPTCKDNEDYCSDPVYYPKDTIQNALKKQYNSLKTILKPAPHASGRSSLDDIVLESRSGYLDEWRNLCDTNTSFINPRVAKNKDGVSMYLVNSDMSAGGELSEYSQQVRITLCAGDNGGMCGALGELSTRCQQEYTHHRLVALDPRGQELVVDEFRFPSCCSCVYSSVII